MPRFFQPRTGKLICKVRCPQRMVLNAAFLIEGALNAVAPY
jgi:hypothetical protein